MSLEKNVARNISVLRHFCFWLDFRPYTPFAIIYFSAITGSYALGMSLFSVIMISNVCFQVPTGIYSDLIGRKRTMMFGAMAVCLALVFYASAHSYLTLFFGALLEGLAQAFFSGNNDALLHESLVQLARSDEYAELTGKNSAMFQSGLGLSALLGGCLVFHSYRTVFWVSALTQIVTVALTFKLINPAVHEKIRPNPFAHFWSSCLKIWRNPRLCLLTSAQMIAHGLGEGSYLFNNVFISRIWPNWALGIYNGLIHAFAGMSYWFSGRIIKRHKPLFLLTWINYCDRLLEVVGYGFQSIFSPIIIALGSLGFGITTVTYNTLYQKEFSNEERATMGSIISIFSSLALGLASLLIGGLADQLGPQCALLIACSFKLFAVPIYRKVFSYGD